MRFTDVETVERYVSQADWLRVPGRRDLVDSIADEIERRPNARELAARRRRHTAA
ncbi:MAG: hypothetical protein JO147_12020 [Actinobacteria bacterium]|nr:hypothetical protein [Actinomycetota bacterium]